MKLQKDIYEKNKNAYKIKKTRQELEIEKMKLELQYRYKISHKDEKTKLVKGNIPKLVITKFQANHLAWLGFWNKFTKEIKKSALAAVSNFFQLKELLVP